MPANMISAPVGSSLIVSGSSMATVSAGPTPGSTPTKVPSVTPTSPHSRFIGCSATLKPCISALSASTSDSRAAQHRREPAGGQVDVEQLDEEKVDGEREDERDRNVARDAPAAEAARNAGEERRAGDHEARPADEHHVGEESGADPEEGGRRKSRIVRRRLAPAAAERLEGQPGAQHDDAGGHDRRNEVRPDTGVAALRRQRRRDRRDAEAERHDAQREGDLRARANHYALFLQAERIHDGLDALRVLVEELLVVVAAEEYRRPVELLQRLLPGGRLGRALHQLDQRVALLRGEAGRAEDAAPVAELDVDLLLLERGDVLLLVRPGLGERAHLARLDLLGEFAEARDARGDVAAEDRGDRLATALERHVVDLRRLDADLLGD